MPIERRFTMKFSLRIAALVGLLTTALFSVNGNAEPEKAGRAAGVDFNREIRPILANYCFECHGPDEHGRKGDLRLDIASEAHASAILPGNAQESPFVERVLTHDEYDRMPPPDSPRQPGSAEIKKLILWIDEGANYDEHWSFVPPLVSEVPSVIATDWKRNEIDAFVLSLLEEKALTPRSDAEPGVLARRLSLSLTGLPVLPEKQAEFEKGYNIDPDKAISDWVDELLAAPAFGEHLAWSWMDAGRYADTNGYQADGERVMWPWRDWLIRSLNANMPYDEMTRQMLAGDLLVDQEWESGDWIAERDDSEMLVATGFLRNHRYDTGSGTIPAESKFENAADRLETVGTVWMGLTMQCARCHTHKFDPIEQREYYSMLSFFDNVPEFGSALKKASHPYIYTPDEKGRARLKGLRERLIQAEADLETVCHKHKASQEEWEKSLSELPKAESVRVRRGLKHRFAESTLTFDGKRSVSESNEPIKMLAGNQKWSISFWFRPDNFKKGAVFSSVEKPEGYRPGIQADWVDGRIRIRQVCKWINSYIEFESVEKLVPGKWYHVSFRSDGRMQGIGYEASLNGDEAAMKCTHPVTNDASDKAGNAPLVLGGSPLMPGFEGKLRDLRFYDRTLNATEVASLADARGIGEIAAIARHDRSVVETQILRHAYLESTTLPDEIAKIRATLFELEKEWEGAIEETPTTMVMREVDRGPTFLHPTGGYDTTTEEVAAGTPAFLTEMRAEEANRLSFAEWLMDPQHPLTARVAVNRIWQFLWGRGFVDSPENFGIQCAEPVHSDLLDWLALEYIRLGWDTKALIKLIVTSRAYRQDSGAAADLWESDPQNRLLARGPRFRLPVQSVRDQALFLSGRLDDTFGGPPVLIDEVKGKDEKATKLPYEFSDVRRTIYTFWKRNGAHPMLAVFDVVDRNQCDVRVNRTNTPLQALVTLNEPGLAACARDFGNRARASSEEESAQLDWAWKACTGNSPTKREASRLAWALDEYRKASDGDEELAWTALANVLLNLDTTLSIH